MAGLEKTREGPIASAATSSPRTTSIATPRFQTSGIASSAAPSTEPERGLRILSLPLGSDTGGVTNAIGHAFRNVEGWEFRSIVSTLNYLEYPRDMEWSKANVRQFWRWADVIHLHHNLKYMQKLRPWHLPRRGLLLEFHGTGFREDPKPHLMEARIHKALPVVATLDLWLLAPDQLEWLPCPTPYRVRHRRNDGMIRIAHAPTNRAIKSTEAVIAAVERLQDDGCPVELDLIEGVTWAECLARKASADIYVDQVLLGYGNNAIECWGMGIPVIAGAQPDTLQEMRRRFDGLPFYNATEPTIYDSLKQMVMSPDLRDEYGQRGLDHVRAFHSEEKVVAQLMGIYERAMR